MDLLTLTVDGAAVWRLTRLVMVDTITAPLRDRVHANAAEAGWVGPWGWLSELGGCAWCVAMWAALGAACGRWWVAGLWAPLAYALALAAVVGHVSPTPPHPHDSDR